MKILLVDDERLILMGLKKYIEKIEDVSCQVETAGNAKQALQILEYFHADLLITDIEMPGMNGLEFLDAVNRRNLCEHTIILSGYDKFEYAKEAIRYGVQDYLLKPVDKEALRENIRAIAQKQKKKPDDRLKAYRSCFAHIDAESVPETIRREVEFIRGNYNQDISLSLLAERFGKKENYLCSLFKREWDVTFLELVNEARLKEALSLLLYHPEMTVKEIAGKIGYRTERQLFRLLRNTTGMTPQQLRERQDTIY